MRQALDILQLHLGGVISTEYTRISAAPEIYTAATITVGSSPIVEQGCFRTNLSKFLTPEVDDGRVTYSYFVTTHGMQKVFPEIIYQFPETISISPRPDSSTSK